MAAGSQTNEFKWVGCTARLTPALCRTCLLTEAAENPNITVIFTSSHLEAHEAFQAIDACDVIVVEE